METNNLKYIMSYINLILFLGFILILSACNDDPTVIDITDEWSEDQKIQASSLPFDNKFGHSVFVDGNRAIVGAYDTNMTYLGGVAYILQRDGGEWIKQKELLSPVNLEGSFFGKSVSISGDRAIVGAVEENVTFANDVDGYSAAGSAYIYHWNGNDWLLQQKLLSFDSKTFKPDPKRNEFFGNSVFINGDTAIVGAEASDSKIPGSVYVFQWDGRRSAWLAKQKLQSSNPVSTDRFGISVSMSNKKIIVGAMSTVVRSNSVGVDPGNAYVFNWDEDANVWLEQQKLEAFDSKTFLPAPDRKEFFGKSVSISGDNAIVGADANDIGSGSAYMFHWDGSAWVGKQKFQSPVGQSGHGFGHSVSIHNKRFVIGARGLKTIEGSAYIYQWDEVSTRWVAVESTLKASNAQAGDKFGESVSIYGDRVMIGADFSGFAQVGGHVYEFSR